ncbi:DUF4055 domain-containing protein [Serratia phage vB_SlqS_ZDD2]|nr:DUF4055 domain-containing protein [Serratia phage vB_SlqS_ZDD2]
MSENLNVVYHHPAYDEFEPEWSMIADCIDGERRIKAEGEVYLPRPEEKPKYDVKSNDRYEAYKARAAFMNATGRTMGGMIGVAFAKPPTVTMKGGMEKFEEDIDGRGQSIQQQIRDALNRNLASGRAGIFSDFTGTGEQSEREKGRPILRLFTAKNIINWRNRDGKDTLIVCEYEEPVDDDAFELRMMKYYLELRLVDGKAKARTWKPIAEGSSDYSMPEFIDLKDANGNHFDEIPWSWIGATNNDHTPDAPPMADIAYMNIKHYQSEADLAELSHLVGQPMFGITGLTQDWVDDNDMSGGIALGARKAVVLPVGGDIKFAQAEERTICLTLAERREKQMAALGAKLIERGVGARTATQAGNEAQTDNSILSLAASNVEDAYNRALKFACRYLSESAEASVELNKRYEIAQLDSAAIQALISAVQGGYLRKADFLRFMQSQSIIDSRDDVEEIEQELEDQEPDLMEREDSGVTDENRKPKPTN